MISSKKITSTLNRFESQLQTLIEGSLEKFSSLKNLDEKTIIEMLVDTMTHNHQVTKDGTVIAPNHFIVMLNQESNQKWFDQESFFRNAKNTLHSVATEYGWHISDTIDIQILNDNSFSKNHVIIYPQIQNNEIAYTKNIDSTTNKIPQNTPKNAFIIVNGLEIYHLNQLVINIGRRPDNDLIIDDQRVSRSHAQLRAINGRYVVFDLDSTYGTCVNNQPIHQSVLFAGDVISLAGYPLIYGQDEYLSGETELYINNTNKFSKI